MKRSLISRAYHAGKVFVPNVEKNDPEHQHHGAEHEEHAQHSHNRILNALDDCEVAIAGGMGRRLVDDLTNAGKKIYITTQHETRKVIEMFLADELSSDKEACGHHE